MDVEGVLEVGADEAIPFWKLPGTSAAAVSNTSGVNPWLRRIPTNAGGLPSPVPGITPMSAIDLGITALGHDFFQQLVGYSEVEQHLIGHGPDAP